MSEADKKLEKIENAVSEFIQALTKSATRDLEKIDTETKTVLIYKILKVLHNKDA